MCVHAQKFVPLFRILILSTIGDSEGSLPTISDSTSGCFHLLKEKLRLQTELVYISRIFHSISHTMHSGWRHFGMPHKEKLLEKNLKSYRCIFSPSLVLYICILAS